MYDDNTQRFETRTSGMKVALKTDRKRRILRGKKRNHWKICFSSSSLSYVEKLIFLSILLSPPLLHAAATNSFFVFDTVDFHLYRDGKKHKENVHWRKKYIHMFKTVIDKTSEKLIKCEIQFDVTIFLSCVSNSSWTRRFYYWKYLNAFLMRRFAAGCNLDIKMT